MSLLPHSFPRLALALAAAAFLGSAARLQAFPIITNVVETGGDADGPTAKWTGLTFNIENPLGTVLVANYVVPRFGDDVKVMTDRVHEYNAASPTVALPDYLIGGEYIMIANDNRDNTTFQLNISVSEPALVYLLIDNRRLDGESADPPFYTEGDPEYWTSGMTWVAAEGFAPMKNGLNRTGTVDWPDEVGIDEAADGDIDQWSSVYFKQVEAGAFSIKEFGEGGRNMYGVVVKALPTSISNPPVISDVAPANNTLFYNATGGLSFKAATVSPNRLDATGIKLTLNGADVSTQLSVGGTPTARTVSYGALQPNTLYAANISVADQAGRTTTLDLRFDTFSASSSVVIEAEDYNYENGKFLASPSPASYAGLMGTPEIDYHDGGTATATEYRPLDTLGLAVSGDGPREPFTTAGATDHQIAGFLQGDWMNYTRTVNAGTYHVYLRVANAAAQVLRLDRVGGDPSTTAQVPTALGRFVLNASTATFAYVPLRDLDGNPVVASFSGVTTLRLSALYSPNPNAQLNFLLLAPTPTPPASYVGAVTPAANITDVPPDAVVTATIVNGSPAVARENVTLSFDGTDVTAAATVTATADGLQVIYDPPGALADNRTYRARLGWQVPGAPAYTTEWSFSTRPFAPVITRVVENGGDDSDNTPAQYTGQRINHPNLGAIMVRTFREDVPAYRDRVHQWNGATAALPLPDYLVGGDYVMIRNDNRENTPFQVDVTVSEPALVYVLVDNRLSDGSAATPPDFTTGLMTWLLDEGWTPVRTGWNRLALSTIPDEIGVDEGGEGVGAGNGIDNYSSIYVKQVPAGMVSLYQADNSGRNMYGVVVRAASTHAFVPVVALTSPAPAAEYPNTPANIPVTATAAVDRSSITKVEFLEAGAGKLGEATSAPYTITWNNVMAGRYRLTAKAIAANGKTAVSDPVEITVGGVVSVNFQATTAVVPDGYLGDFGYVFGDQGNGYSYGWDDDNTAHARDRNNILSPDERYDTFNHMQKTDPLPAGRVWEIDLPNGPYRVHAVVGESNNYDGVYDLQAEGRTIVSGTPTSAVRWFEGTAIVTVSDGRLTLSNGPTAVNNKIAYVDIASPPGEAARPVIAPPILNQGNVTITWTGGGKLQEASDLPGAWSDVAGNPQGAYVTLATAPRKFYRVVIP